MCGGNCYPKSVMQRLKEQREENHQLCDVVIHVGGEAFHAHKAVLAAKSSYFMAMFTSGFKESTEKEIQLEGDADIFKVLLQYVYTGILETTPLNVFEVLSMAGYLQFADLRKIMFSVFRHVNSTPQISVADLMKTLELAKHHDIKGLVSRIETHMVSNMLKFRSCAEFLQDIGVEVVEKFLDKGNLHDERQVS